MLNIVAAPKKINSMLDIRLIHKREARLHWVLNRFIRVLRIQNQAAEPQNTPKVSNSACAKFSIWSLSPRAAKIAAKENIVSGLVSVRNMLEK